MSSLIFFVSKSQKTLFVLVLTRLSYKVPLKKTYFVLNPVTFKLIWDEKIDKWQRNICNNNHPFVFVLKDMDSSE